jgi:hypothetical protein
LPRGGTKLDETPDGIVNLKGAIVMESMRIPLAFEIHTGGLFSERGVGKRTYIFTPESAGTRAPSMIEANHISL